MNLTELQNEVFALTNRPDLASQTLSAIRSATLKAHRLDYFYKDLVEQGVQFSEETYLQQINYRDIFPRYRAMKYLERTDSNGTTTGQFFDLILPDNVLDEYGIYRNDVCYVAGQIIQVRASSPVKYCIAGWYQNPDVTVNNYSSWIADEFPYYLIYDAAMVVSRSVGKDAAAVTYRDQSLVESVEIKNSNIVANGY